MSNPVRSIRMAGVALLTASAVIITPSVQPLPPPRPVPTIQLAAAAQLLPEQPPLLTVLLQNPLQLLGPAAPFGTLPPAPAPLAIPIAPNLANTIDAIYTAVEPWVRYGFEVATSIVRWIPYVGWFAGQIMVFYNFFESMVASGVFNFTDFLRGDGGIGTNLVDFGIDVGLAFVWLGLDEVAQFIPLPPFCCYPPRPPVQGPFLAAAETATSTETASPTETTELSTATEKSTGKPAAKDAESQQAASAGDETVVETEPVKAPKEPKEPKVTTEVSAQGEVRGAPDADATESTKDPGTDKKADKGPTAKDATDSSTSTSDATKNDDNDKKKADKE